MPLLRKTLVVLALLSVTGVALGASLPLLLPLQAVCGKGNWRSAREFAAWPGSQWRGPDQPPTTVSAEDPRTWGQINLAPGAEPPLPVQVDVFATAVPLVSDRPVLDGTLGFEEWQSATEIITRLGDGEELVVLLQRTEHELFVLAAAPWVNAPRLGLTAEVCFDRNPSATATLGPQHLLLKATQAAPEVTSLQAFTGEGGRWRPEPAPAKDAAWRVAGGGDGDGAWRYPVFEFAIPLSRLKSPDRELSSLGLFVRLQTLSGGRFLAPPPPSNAEAVFWPDSRTSLGTATKASLALRPDFWGHLRLHEDDPVTGLSVPVAAGPVRVDGQIGLKEWKGAGTAEYRFAGDQWRVLRVQRDDKSLYLAVRVRLSRGERSGESCGVYLDPLADGGLRPRNDDMLYSIPLGVETKPVVLRYGAQGWAAQGEAPCEAAAYPLSPNESCYELALPLNLFTAKQAPNLAVEVTYELPR